MDVYELQENLFLYLEEEFSIVLEDESDKQVAEMICRLFEQCCQKEDLSLYNEIMAMEHKVNSAPVSKPMVKVEGELDESDDEMDVEMEQNTSMVENSNYPNMEEYVSAPLFAGGHDTKKNTVSNKPVRQLGEESQMPQPQPVDEDGFATVSKSTRRSRRSKN